MLPQTHEPEQEDTDASRPWLRFYDPGVPPHLDYPRMPLWQLLDNSPGLGPDKRCTNFVGRRMRYRQIKEASDRCAAGLQRTGVRRGDRVALLLPNCPQFLIAYFGLLKAGATAALLNPLLTERELAYHVSHAGAEILITIPMFLEKALALQAQAVVRQVIYSPLSDYLPFPASAVMGWQERKQLSAARRAQPGASGTAVKLSDLLAVPPPAGFRPEPADPDETAVLLYSGGTTGTSKAVALSHFNCVANAYQAVAWAQMLNRPPEEEGSMLAVLPLFHGLGMSITMNASVAAGGEIILVPRFKPRDVAKTIQKYHPRYMIGVPTMFVAFNTVPGIERYDLRGIEGIFVGAAPLTRAIKDQFEARTGARMLEGYGLTEAVTAIMANPLRGQHKLGSIGIPFPDVDMKIVDIEDGHDLPVGERGEITLRSPTVMIGYEGDPEATAKTIVEGGWLRTGDIGHMDEDGYFYITDRKKELIIVSGFNVFPREIDEVIYEHPKVQEGICVGVPDEYQGEHVKAFIVLKPGETATVEEFIAYFRERLVSYKAPAEVEFRSALPKNAIGKVLRRALKEEPRG